MQTTVASQQQTAINTADKPRVCFVNHNAWGQLTNNPMRHAGGAERQCAIVARWFAANGYATSMIVWDEGQPDDAIIDGVRGYKICRPDDGLPIIRFIHPRWTSLNAALRRADADIYLYNRGDLGLGQVVRWCRRNRRKSLYLVASNIDCQRDLPAHDTLRERVLYKDGLKHADAVITQTALQQEMLRDNFQRESQVRPMPGDYAPSESSRSDAPTPNDATVFWVGRISKEKRLEWLLDLAEKFPRVRFNVAGAANAKSDYERTVRDRAEKIANVTLLGRLSQAEIRPYYESAALLCNTSIYEGFPNTFLESWSVGLPLLTTYQPDDIVEQHKLGWMCHSFDELCQNLTKALENAEEWTSRSGNAWQYYRKHHALDVAMKRYAEVATQLVST